MSRDGADGNDVDCNHETKSNFVDKDKEGYFQFCVTCEQKVYLE